MFVWNLCLYTVKRAEVCTSHKVLNINSIHSILQNSCSFPTLPSWGYRGGKADVNSLSATDCFNTVGSFQPRDVCHANGTHHNGKSALFEGSQHLHNSLKFSSPLQDLLDWAAGLLCLMQAGHHPFFPSAWRASFSLASVWGIQGWKRRHLSATYPGFDPCLFWVLSIFHILKQQRGVSEQRKRSWLKGGEELM